MYGFRKMILSSMLMALAGEAFAQDNENYPNPIDGKTYVAPGGWHQYQAEPQHPATSTIKTDGVKLDYVRLLNSQSDLEQRVTVKDLGDFIANMQSLAENILSKDKNSFKVMVQFNCSPGKCPFKLAVQGNADKTILQEYYDSLMHISPLETKGEASFQIELAIH